MRFNRLKFSTYIFGTFHKIIEISYVKSKINMVIESSSPQSLLYLIKQTKTIMWKYEQFSKESAVCFFLNERKLERKDVIITHDGDLYTVFYKVKTNI